METKRIIVGLCLITLFALFSSAASAQETTQEPIPETTREPAPAVNQPVNANTESNEEAAVDNADEGIVEATQAVAPTPEPLTVEPTSEPTQAPIPTQPPPAPTEEQVDEVNTTQADAQQPPSDESERGADEDTPTPHASVDIPEGVGIILPSVRRVQERENAQAQQSSATAPPPNTPVEGASYEVRSGDTLFRIAQSFNTTTEAIAEANGITNPSLIFAGQTLIIPGSRQPGDATPEPTETRSPTTQPTVQPTLIPTPTSLTPAETEEPTVTPPTDETANSTYVVQRGDTLYRIAVRNNTTVTALAQANNIGNPNVIFAGQEIRIPGEATPPANTQNDAESDADNDTSANTDNQQTVSNADFDYGINVYFNQQDVSQVTAQIEELGMNWVKVRVDWRNYEPTQGEIDLTELDTIVAALDDIGVDILLNLTNAPDWARDTSSENGPPQDLSTFTNFSSTVANNYAGVVDAYQIWDEPNIRRNWRCTDQVRICDTDYVEMMRSAYTAIKAADSDAIVVTAGLGPTRFNDRQNAVDDLLYLTTLYANGIAEVSDAIGIHPGSWANPPDAACCDASTGVESHFENEVFYFRENLRNYRQIMIDAGDQDTALWVTKFGWGTGEGTSSIVSNYEYVQFTDLGEQAIYTVRAFELGAELGYVGPMFVDSLNACQGLVSLPETCYTSLLGPDGEPRLVFAAVAQIDKRAESPTDE